MFIDCPTIGNWFLNNRNFKLFLTNTNVTSRSLNTSWSIFIEQLVNTFVKWYRKSGITVVDNLIRWDTNDLPGKMTLRAKLRWPSKLNNCLFVHEFFPVKASITAWILTIFSLGRRASILTGSKYIPKYSMTGDGPSVFFAESGIPKFLKIFKNVFLTSPTLASAGRITKNHLPNVIHFLYCNSL